MSVSVWRSAAVTGGDEPPTLSTKVYVFTLYTNFDLHDLPSDIIFENKEININ
jgi:hypothetical protein